MINNLVLRRLRYALNLREAQIQHIFALAGFEIKPVTIAFLLKKEHEKDYVECTDVVLEKFLDGLIIKHRGARDDQPEKPKTQKVRLNNNIILKKIRIALELREEDLLDIMEKADFRFSKPELSAFFRKPGSRNYKPCGDQVMRNFLIGICEKNRPSAKKNQQNKK